VHIDKNIAVNVPDLAKRLFFICNGSLKRNHKWSLEEPFLRFFEEP